MINNEKNVKDMTVGSPARLFLAFSLPLMVGNIFQQLYTVVDTMVVGQVLGTTALAAVGAVDWFNWMFLGIMTGLTQGFAILIAQKFGEGDIPALRRVSGNSLVLSAILGILLTIAGQLLIMPMLHILRAPADVIPMSRSYLQVILGGTLVVIFYNMFAAILRALGDSQTPLRAMMAAAVTNVGLDIFFVAVLSWGVEGAAIATVLAQLLAALLCLRKILKIDILTFSREDFQLKPEMVIRMLYLGLPMALQNILISIGGMIVQSVVNGFGVLFMAAYTATNKLYGLLEIAAISFGYAMVTYTGQNLGAGRADRIKQGVRAAVIIGILTSVLISIVMLVFGRHILGLFISATESDRAATIDTAYEFLMIMSLFLSILYVLHIIRSALQGMGNAMVAMASGIAEFIVRTAVALTLPAIFGYHALFYGEVLAWAGADLVLIAGYIYNIRKLTAR